MAQPTSHRDLLRDFAERKPEQAFQALVERHIDVVFATALCRVNDAAAAQEVAQNVLIALARKAVWLRSQVSLTTRAASKPPARQKANSHVQPSTVDMLAGASPASAMDGWAE